MHNTSKFIFKNSLYKTTAIVTSLLIGLSGCGGSSSSQNNASPLSGSDPEDAVFSKSIFQTSSAIIDNPYFPLTPGKTYIYEGNGERIEVAVSHETKTILGVESIVVVDRAYEDGELVEETFDWYAQDIDGNVWYMGEDSKEYEDGEAVSSDGSWEAGLDIDGVGYVAEAGIQMKASPFTIGDTYLQENYPNIAEDMAKIIATDVVVDDIETTLADGSEVKSFTTLQTLEWVPLDDDPASTEEYKYFAAGVGLVLETNTTGDERITLVEVHDDTMPNIDPEDFENSTVIDNKYFPLIPGTTYRFKTTVGEDEELIIYEVLSETREVMGITTVVVRDRVYINGDENTGLLLEDTRDWFAQDDDGNVWYMGEEVDNYDELTGELLDHGGSWEAGIDGAQPGIQMKTNPRAGDSYHQEFYAGEAEDLATVVDNDVSVTLADGTTYSTIMIKEWNPLEEDSTEFKYFAAAVGFILEEKLDESDVVVEAIELLSIDIQQTFESIEIAIDNNIADQEAQVIIAGSAEPDFFKKLACYAPNGQTISKTEIEDVSGDYADFQFDSAKTDLSELALAYPAGTYWCIGVNANEKTLIGSSQLSYDFLESVIATSPVNGEVNVTTTALTISWDPVVGANSIAIDIENSVTGASLEVDLAGDTTSFTVPDGLLAAGTFYEVGFEAVHTNGNASVTENYGFTTAGIFIDPGSNDKSFGNFESLAFHVVYNGTDDDAQVIIEAEAFDETIMTELSITGPNGEEVNEMEFKDSEDLGITDVLFESSEPSISVLEQDFPAGIYIYSATFINDNDLEYIGTGTIELSYDILALPAITFPLPANTGIFPGNAFTITWANIPAGAKAIHLEIEADLSGETFSVDLDTNTTEFTIPANWMIPNTEYVIDLEVVHDNDNVTVVDVIFTTEL